MDEEKKDEQGAKGDENSMGLRVWLDARTRPRLSKQHAKTIGAFLFVVASGYFHALSLFELRTARQHQQPAPPVEAKAESKPAMPQSPDSGFKVLEQSISALSSEVVQLRKDSDAQKKETTDCKSMLKEFCEEIKDELPTMQPLDTRRAIRNAVKKIEDRLKPVSKAPPEIRAIEGGARWN
jgi:hypothetical protein